LTIILISISVIAFGQFGNEFNISRLDNWNKFESLTTLEAKHHKRNERSYERRDRSYKADSLYLPTLSKDEKKFLYEEYELKQRFNYKENRARYFVEYIEEDSIMVDKTFSMPDTLSTECRCELKNDTIEVKMGIGVFGGFSFNISIIDKTFQLVYVDDTHEMEPFKYRTTDTSFVEDLILQVDNATLTFSNKIKRKIGHKINGHLKFTSPEYFVNSNFRGYSWESKLEKGVTKGEIYFTCKLREPFEPPNE
jgi:hypothetical protein